VSPSEGQAHLTLASFVTANRWWERNCDEENSWGLRINKVRGRKFRQRRKALKNQRVHN
jgi:hypothetical protein